MVIIGGGVGGCAAALAAARAGLKVIMTESTDWIGGQFTAQCLSAPDEHPYIEYFGRTASYATYRELVRDFYRRHYPLTTRARANRQLNPGDGWVSGLCHEPQVALSVLYQMLAPYLSTGILQILLQAAPVAADTNGDSILSVTVKHQQSCETTVLHGKYFLDATEAGELLAISNTEFVVGAEGRKATGELHAADEANALDIQSITYCFAVDYVPNETFTIERPQHYKRWKNYVPTLNPPWPGRLFAMHCSSPYHDAIRLFQFDPGLDRVRGERYVEDSSLRKVEDLWTYRRLLSKHHFAPGTYAGSITLVNWPQNDYWMGNVIGVAKDQMCAHLLEAKQLSLSFLYWLQTEAPRPDGGLGWPGLRLRKDISGTEDGLAKTPYYRESRRIKAIYTVTEADIGRAQRAADTHTDPREVKASFFKDSVGVGLYRMDAHPTTGGRNYVDIDALPHQIPLGSMIPIRINNLIPAAKNIGTTHVSSTAYREHPIEWNVGESAGILAAYCLAHNAQPRAVHADPMMTEELQKTLLQQGVELNWPAHIL